MIAMALLCHPKLLIADEPTTALDVTVQKDIIELLKGLQKKRNMSVLFISHDLALVKQLADRVAVMYQGKIIEENSTQQLFNKPTEPYTKGLLFARPSTTKRLHPLPPLMITKVAPLKHTTKLQRNAQINIKNYILKLLYLKLKKLKSISQSIWTLSKKAGFQGSSAEFFSLSTGDTGSRW